MKNLVMAILLIPIFSSAQYTDENIWKDYKQDILDYREIEKEEEILLRNESIIYEKNKSLGTKDEGYYTGLDNHFFSVQYHTTSKLHHFANFSSFEAVYGYRVDNWWLEMFADFTTAQFEDVSENKSNLGPGAGGKPSDLTEQITRYGVGVSYRFKMLNHFAEWDQVFNTVSAFATLASVNEQLSEVDANQFTGLATYNDQTYSGYGYKAAYGLHYRSNRSFIYGLRLSYNASWVKREKIDSSESDDDVHMSLSWMTFGAEMGWYF